MTEQDDVIIHFWQDVVNRALQTRASDIHVEPENGVSHIRLRVDGRLKKLTSSPSNWHERIVSRIKILARLDIAEKRLPQDGQMLIGYQANTPTIDCRISTLPTLHGEKIVLRILNKSDGDLNLNMLGFTDKQLSDLKHALSCQQGFILVTGPTGSGKTHTLYSCLKQLMDGTKNLTSIEDPIEVQLKGVNQVHVNEKAGLRFDTALRALMRQDPDVIMVGEIRDLKTAEVAFQAAETGHLVLATLHANDAPSALWRLKQLGIGLDQLANNLICITAQRLVRLFCHSCAGKSALENEMSCNTCDSTGFKGRTGIHQVLPINHDLRVMIEAGATLTAINHYCHSSQITNLNESAQILVEKGITSQDEVMRYAA
jgi:type II secretory ATPase GspE/PulE/Tfp pilus assembly ATPase PilB-like protein